MTQDLTYRTKVSSRGQVVIPKEVREKVGVDSGTELTVTVLDDNTILLEKVPPLSELFGFMGTAEASKALLKKRESETKAEKERRVELRTALARKRKR